MMERPRKHQWIYLTYNGKSYDAKVIGTVDLRIRIDSFRPKAGETIILRWQGYNSWYEMQTTVQRVSSTWFTARVAPVVEHTDRRQNLRRRIRLPLRVYDQRGHNYAAYTREIGLRSLQFQTANTYSVGDELLMHLEGPSEGRQTYPLPRHYRGKVIRIDEDNRVTVQLQPLRAEGRLRFLQALEGHEDYVHMS